MPNEKDGEKKSDERIRRNGLSCASSKWEEIGCGMMITRNYHFDAALKYFIMFITLLSL